MKIIPEASDPPPLAPEAHQVCLMLREVAPAHYSHLFVSYIIRNNPKTIQESSNDVWGDTEDP